ncbi:MAG: hypothetical protein HOW73_34630 [Polyangiaceae bacterium]|nr:hypothetical protein [Polyangiaceae bacterium]
MAGVGFRHLIVEAAPPRLRRPWGEKFLYSFGLALDGIMDWAIEGMRARYPDKGPPDALPLIGRDRKILRGFAEPADAYRARLKRWLDDHRFRGNAFALLQQIRAYLTGYPVRIRCVNDRGSWQTINPDGSYEVHRKQGNWDWDGRFPLLARTRFWVIIYPLATGVWTNEGTWGDGARWGDAGTWGTSATVEQVNSIRQLVAEWKPMGTRCPYIIVAFDENSFDPTDPAGDPLPDGDWGNYMHLVGGVAQPSRLKTARYWKGTS